MSKLGQRLYRSGAQQSTVREAFADLGEDDRVARVLAGVVELDAATPSAIAEYTGYAYHTVLNTLQELEERGWLDAEEISSPKRGRNPASYRLKASSAAIRRHYQADLRERLARLKETLH